MKKTNKIFALLLCMSIFLTLFAGCSNEDDFDASESSEATEETTEETVDGYEGEKGKPLTVDFTTHGTRDEGAAALNTKTFLFNGTTYEYPFSIASMLENGWRFYSEDVSLQTVSASTEASVMGFNFYHGDLLCAELSRIVNASEEVAPVKDCTVSCMTIYTTQEESDDALSFVLPGGITDASTAADVIEVFGPALDNMTFESVQTGASLLYYSCHKETGLSYAFGFRDDGTIESVMIFT